MNTWRARSTGRVCAAIAAVLIAAEAPAEEPDAAAIFAPGLISTGREYGLTMSPDGEVIYFTRGASIYWSRRLGEIWSPPREASFASSDWIDRYRSEGAGDVTRFAWDPVIAPDGSHLFFMSHGLIDGRIASGEDGDWDLWVMDRIAAGFGDDAWGPPQPVGWPVNSPDHQEGAAGIDLNGTLYFFARDREPTFGSADLYAASLEAGSYGAPRNLGPNVNSDNFDGHAYVDPAGEFLLFISANDPNGFGSCDIYVSWRTESGWGERRNLGPNVNSPQCELTPSLSADGSTLFFARIEPDDEGSRNLYTIDLRSTAFHGASR